MKTEIVRIVLVLDCFFKVYAKFYSHSEKWSPSLKRESEKVMEELWGSYLYNRNLGPHTDADSTVPELLEKYGYPVESHEVVTKDGYILTLHRIPHGKSNKGFEKEVKAGRPVVFLQHGLLCSSADWLMNTVDKALGYQLADKGYDVWLGNARGNIYSRRHVSLSPHDSKFWNFSFHEMGYFDIPAVIDHILKVTNQVSLSYIGHSMGTTMFWVAMSEHPGYNQKIKAMFGLAPVAFVKRSRSPIRIFSPFAMDLEKAAILFGNHEFLPHSSVITFFQKTVCEEKYLRDAICENIMFLLCGFDRPQLNETMVPIILGHTPAGTSTQNIIHYMQMMSSGKFRRFDYGSSQNIVIYGSKDPPRYSLSRVKVPVALYWGENDWLAVKEDVLELRNQLPNVVLNYRVNLTTFNHLDFIYAKDCNKLLYNDLINPLKIKY